MAGTLAGGLKAAAKNKALHGENFYKRIGAIGGRNGITGGFASANDCDGRCGLNDKLGVSHRTAQCAGYKGGTKSRRTKKVV